jgi:hypothetical protein
VIGRAVLVAVSTLAALLLTAEPSAAECGKGLINTIAGAGDGCGGAYPAVGSAAAVALAIAAFAGHAALSYTRGGRLEPTSGKLSAGAMVGLDPTPDTIRHGTVRMEEHPDYAATIAMVEVAGFTIVEAPKAQVVIRRVVGADRGTLRIERELRVITGMRYLDLEHEVGHINQVLDTARFPEGPLPTDIVKEVPTGYADADDQSGKLTSPMNVAMEYHNRLQELIWLNERGAPHDIMLEHLGGIDGIDGITTDGKGWAKKYTDLLRSPTKSAWANAHFPDIADLEAVVASIRERVRNDIFSRRR